MTLEKDLEELNSALKDLKAKTVDRFIEWFWKIKYAKIIYILLYVISGAYVLTSFYLTFNQ